MKELATFELELVSGGVEAISATAGNGSDAQRQRERERERQAQAEREREAQLNREFKMRVDRDPDGGVRAGVEFSVRF